MTTKFTPQDAERLRERLNQLDKDRRIVSQMRATNHPKWFLSSVGNLEQAFRIEAGAA